jgi:hypothetical protein
VMGGHVGRVALLFQERRTTHAGTVATDAPCCELSHRKLKFWVWGDAGVILRAKTGDFKVEHRCLKREGCHRAFKTARFRT